MKLSRLIFSASILLSITACHIRNGQSKTKSDAAANSDAVSEAVQTHSGETAGVVSHRFKAQGCSVVIVFKTDDGTQKFLYPKDVLDSKFDIDELSIYFNYRLLKMKSPDCCAQCLPAEITDVSIK